MYLKIIMQIQITSVSKSTENKPIKTLHKVLLLPLSLLFIIVSSITLVHSSITLPINLFLQTQFYDLNIVLVYTKSHIDIHKYLDSMYILYHNLPHQQNLHYNRIYKYHRFKFVYYYILKNLIYIRIYHFHAIIHYEFRLTSSKNYKLAYLLS